ncbi:hypothetical protein KTH71_05025 [Acinetobacter sp. WU_MDCI_Axc73]|nr:hypothetical protein [Acinetobacter sp. WU_MDCI_Axc73]
MPTKIIWLTFASALLMTGCVVAPDDHPIDPGYGHPAPQPHDPPLRPGQTIHDNQSPDVDPGFNRPTNPDPGFGRPTNSDPGFGR